MSSGFGAARCWMRGCLVDVLTHQSRFMRLLCTTVHKHTHTHTKPDAARTIWCKILTLSVQLVHFLNVGYNIPLDVTPQEEASKPHLHMCCAWSIWSFHTFYKIIQLMLHSEVRRCQKEGLDFSSMTVTYRKRGGHWANPCEARCSRAEWFASLTEAAQPSPPWIIQAHTGRIIHVQHH